MTPIAEPPRNPTPVTARNGAAVHDSDATA
jgi:hypothetical protein